MLALGWRAGWSVLLLGSWQKEPSPVGRFSHHVCHQNAVAQKVDKFYSADGSIGFPNTYQRDSELSGG